MNILILYNLNENKMSIIQISAQNVRLKLRVFEYLAIFTIFGYIFGYFSKIFCEYFATSFIIFLQAKDCSTRLQETETDTGANLIKPIFVYTDASDK